MAQAIEDIVVTAQKRQQRIVDVPASISAITGEQLERAGLNDIRTFAAQIPGLNFSNHADLKTSETSIRGVRSESRSAGQDPAVATYLDEVYLGGGVGAGIDFYDLERIEVLRGPQGALFGRNTIGGVISLTTRRPTFEPEAYLELGVGNYNLWEGRAAVSGPLVADKLAIRMAGLLTDRGGFTTNLSTGADIEQSKRRSVRGSVLLIAGERTEFLLTADYLDVNQRSNALETLSYASGAGNLLARAIGGFPGPNSDPFDRKVFGDFDPVERMKASGTSLRITVDLDQVELVSISGYREHSYFGRYDTEQTDATWTYSASPEDVWRASQEVRLTSTGGGPLQWVIGGFYFAQRTINEFRGEFGNDLLTTLRLPPGFFVSSYGNQKTTSYAGFGSATYAFTDRISVTAGARYTWDDKRIVYDQNDAIGVIGGSRSFEANRSFDAFTPNVSLNVKPSEDLLIYGLVSRGFKSGGFNDFIGDATAVGFGPETLWNFEAGVKGQAFDRRLQFSASAFTMQWKDIQLQADNPNTPFFDPATRNAGAARSRGLELEMQARPTEELRLSLAGALIDARFTEGFLPDGVTPLREIPNSPDYTLNLTGAYRVPISSSLDLEATGELLLVGRDVLDITNVASSEVAPYQQVNAFLVLSEKSGGWSITLWGRNLTNQVNIERYFGLLTNPLNGQELIALNAPRTFGVRVRADF
jgi:iron complex outermembrane receptor protein